MVCAATAASAMVVSPHLARVGCASVRAFAILVLRRLARPAAPKSSPAAGLANPLVIPGRRAAASPEPINTGLWNMGSGPAAARHPGMTGILALLCEVPTGRGL